MDTKYYNGERVVGVGVQFGKNIEGCYGTVCDVETYSKMIGVCWDKIPCGEAHDCGGHCSKRHGWYVSSEYLLPLLGITEADFRTFLEGE